MNPDLLKAFRDKNSYRISELVALGDPNLFIGRSPQGNTALHLAARFRDKHFVQQILNHGDSSSFLYETNLHGETPMHIAAKFGYASVIKLFLEYDNNRMIGREGGRDNILWMRDSQLNTPLHKAVANRQESAAILLINSDPLTTLFVNKANESPLSIAIDKGSTYIAWFIIKEYLPSLDYRGGTNDLTLLHSVVIRRDYVFVVEILNRNSGLIHTKDNYGRNPLHYAAAVGNFEIAKQLLKANASSSLGYQGDCNGLTPLHLAALNGRISILRLLLIDYPDSIDAVDGKQNSILHLAARNGHANIVRFVMNLPEVEDLMINSTDVDGNTPLHLAAMNFHWQVVDILCKNKRVNIRATNHNQLTALAIVESSTDPHKDIKKQYLTVKTLKEAITARAFYPEDLVRYTRFHAMERDAIKIRIGEKRDMVKTLLVMATLIATFTFTAAFTIPGGYNNDGPNKGMAVLVTRSGFRVFVIAVTIAMTASMTAAVLALGQIHYGKDKRFKILNLIPVAISLIWLGLVSMSVAFVTGLFVVLSNNDVLAWSVVCIGGAFPIYLYVLGPLLGLPKLKTVVALLYLFMGLVLFSIHPLALSCAILFYLSVRALDFDSSYLFYLMESASLRWYDKVMKTYLNSELYPCQCRRTRLLVLLGILRLLRTLIWLLISLVFGCFAMALWALSLVYWQ